MRIRGATAWNGLFIGKAGNRYGDNPLLLILLTALLTFATAAGAQKPLTLSGSPLKGKGDLKTQSFLVANEPAKPASTSPTPTKTAEPPAKTSGTPAKTPGTPAKASGTPSGGSPMILTNKTGIQVGAIYIKVTIKPHIEASGDGTMTVFLDKDHVTSQVVQGQQGETFTPVTGTAPHTDMDDPTKYIQEVRAIFDNGTVPATGTGGSPRVIQLPLDAAQLKTLEVDYAWKGDKKTLKFRPTPPPTHRLRWIVGGAGAAVIAIIGVALMLRRRKLG